MKNSAHLQSALVGIVTLTTASLFLVAPAWAQNAPGEDPVVLTKRVSVQMLPIGGARPSSSFSSQTGMPAWMQAKVARFEAKANSDQHGSILTDSDVVRSASSDGLKKTCVQEVGSNTVQTAGQVGLSNTQQIVVLKGDLINICR